MAVRTDVTIRQDLSPRLAEISTGNGITIQDTHDTLTGLEDKVSDGSEFGDLISTAGGEDLGGGASVGLTATLENVQLAPTGTTPREQGSVTNADTTGVTLEDNTATFVTNGVQRGDWVLNWTDHSVTEVLEVLSETQLVTRGLRNGISNQFTLSDQYDVYEVSEFVVDGGNIVAVDDTPASINPVFTSFGRFISRASSSSATQVGGGGGSFTQTDRDNLELTRDYSAEGARNTQPPP